MYSGWKFILFFVFGRMTSKFMCLTFLTQRFISLCNLNENFVSVSFIAPTSELNTVDSDLYNTQPVNSVSYYGIFATGDAFR